MWKYFNDSIRLSGGECSPSRPPAANLNAPTVAATQWGHANLAAAAWELALSEMRRSNASSHYCKFALSQLESYVFLHVATVAAQVRGMVGWRGPVPDTK